MMSIAKTAKIFVGVDVSKATLDVYRPDTNELLKIENLECHFRLETEPLLRFGWLSGC